MRTELYFYLLIAIISCLAIVLYPTDTELIYVFEQSKDLPRLANYYKKKLNKNYDNQTAFKYLTVLKKLNKPDYFNEAEKYLKKYKNRKVIDDAINYALSKKDYKRYVEWLNKGYNLTKDISYLKRLIDYYSYKNNNKKLIATIKRIYHITKDEKWLNLLYGLGEKDFVIAEYLKQSNLTEEKIKLIINYFSEKKDYKNYIKYLELAYEKTKDINYLIQEKNLLSFLKKKQDLIKILKRLFKLTNDYKYLDDLYDIGEKEYVIKKYEENFSNLSMKLKRKLLQYYIWNNKKEKILFILTYFFNKGKFTEKDEKYYVSLLSFLGKYKELINFYTKMYNRTKKIKYLKKLADAYNYYGEPVKAAKIYYKIFKITKDKKYLNEVISIYFDLNDFENFLKFNFIKLKNFYSEKLLKQLVSFLVENNRLKMAINLVKNYYKEHRELFHLLVNLYLIENRKNETLKILLTHKPQTLTEEELNFIANYKVFNEKFIPYIERYYRITKNRYYIFKILKFYADNMAFYKFNRLFKRYFGKINEKNYLTYFNLIPDKFKKFKISEAYRIAQTTFNITLLNNLAIFLMGENEQKKSEKIFKKVLFLDGNNLTALEYLAKLYYWQNNYEGALILFLKYDSINPTNSVIKFYIGEIYWNKKKYDLAKKYFKYVVKHIKKDTLEKHMIYLKSYVFLYGIDNVLDEYRKVVKESGFNKDIYADFIDALYFSRKFKILKEEYEKFKKMSYKYRNYVRLLRLFALYNIEVRKFSEALKLLDKTMSIIEKKGIKNSTIFADYGYLYLRKGDKIKALKYYEKAFLIDKNNLDLRKIVTQLEDEFSTHATVFYEYKNKVKSEGFEFEYPYREKLWLGFGYKIYELEKSEIFFKIQDINRILYNFEIGVNHINFTVGNKLKFYFKEYIFENYLASVHESMKQRKIGASLSKEFGKFSFYSDISKNFYRNEHGKVSKDFSLDSSLTYSINDYSYISCGFSYVKVNYYRDEKSDVFFDNYRAVSLFYGKNYFFHNESFNFQWNVGGIYDLINKSLNYSFLFNLKYKNKFFAEYNLYYDAFTHEQVNFFEIKIRIRF